MDYEKRATEFANTFSSFVNEINREPKRLAIQKLLNDHRTLQQGMMRFFMEFVEGMATNGYDLRNEDSVNLASEIMKIDERKRILRRI